MINLKRKITHTEYKKISSDDFTFNKKMYMISAIYNSNIKFNKKEINDNFIFHNADYLTMSYFRIADYVYLFMTGIFFIVTVYDIFNSQKGEVNWFNCLIIFLFLFFVVYYFTAPKKEFILNRKDGLITFPGFMWMKNITMPIKKVIFSRTSPNLRGWGADELQIERPYLFNVKYYIKYKSNCYDDLSYLIWYMDKNRPLPPGEAFDEFRQSDFERRKAEGFPEPIFESNILTPEATPEQQAERERIGRW